MKFIIRFFRSLRFEPNYSKKLGGIKKAFTEALTAADTLDAKMADTIKGKTEAMSRLQTQIDIVATVKGQNEKFRLNLSKLLGESE